MWGQLKNREMQREGKKEMGIDRNREKERKRWG
jgi:hypothetical protein